MRFKLFNHPHKVVNYETRDLNFHGRPPTPLSLLFSRVRGAWQPVQANLIKFRNSQHRETTLVEVLIFTAVGSILLVSISSVYLSGLRARALVDAQQRLVYADEFVLATLQSWVHSASSIQTPASGTSNQLVFTPQEGGSTTVELSGTDLQYSTSLLEMGTLNALGIDVTRFDVTRMSGEPDTIRIEITYQVGTSTQRVLEHSTVYAFSTFYE